MTHHSDAGEAQTRGPSVSSQALYIFCTTEPLRSHICECFFEMKYAVLNDVQEK